LCDMGWNEEITSALLQVAVIEMGEILTLEAVGIRVEELKGKQGFGLNFVQVYEKMRDYYAVSSKLESKTVAAKIPIPVDEKSNLSEENNSYTTLFLKCNGSKLFAKIDKKLLSNMLASGKAEVIKFK